MKELFERRFWETIREFDDGMIGRDGLKARVNRLYNGYGISKPLFFGRYAKTGIIACFMMKSTTGFTLSYTFSM